MASTTPSAETEPPTPSQEIGRETGAHYDRLVSVVSRELNWQRLFATAIVSASPLLLLAACGGSRIDIQAAQASALEQPNATPTELIQTGKIARPVMTNTPRPTHSPPTPEPTQTVIPEGAFKVIVNPEPIKESDPFVQEIASSTVYQNNALTENGETVRLIWAKIDIKNLREAITKAAATAINLGISPQLVRALLSHLTAIRFTSPNYWDSNRLLRIAFPGIAAHEAGHALGGAFSAPDDAPESDKLLAEGLSEMVPSRLYAATYPWDKAEFTDARRCGLDHTTNQRYMLDYNKLVKISLELEAEKYPRLWAQIVTAHGNFEQSQILTPLSPETDLSTIQEYMDVNLLINNDLAKSYQAPASQIKADLLKMVQDSCDFPMPDYLPDDS